MEQLEKIEIIFNTICDTLREDQNEVKETEKKTRKRNIVLTRQLIMTFACLKTKLTLAEIGKYFSGKDHTTVIYARKTVNNLLDIRDKNVTKKYKACEITVNRAMKVYDNSMSVVVTSLEVYINLLFMFENELNVKYPGSKYYTNKVLKITK